MRHIQRNGPSHEIKCLHHVYYEHAFKTSNRRGFTSRALRRTFVELTSLSQRALPAQVHAKGAPTIAFKIRETYIDTIFEVGNTFWDQAGILARKLPQVQIARCRHPRSHRIRPSVFARIHPIQERIRITLRIAVGPSLEETCARLSSCDVTFLHMLRKRGNSKMAARDLLGSRHIGASLRAALKLQVG